MLSKTRPPLLQETRGLPAPHNQSCENNFTAAAARRLSAFGCGTKRKRASLSRLFLNFIAGFFHIFADPVSRIPATHRTQRE